MKIDPYYQWQKCSSGSVEPEFRDLDLWDTARPLTSLERDLLLSCSGDSRRFLLWPEPAERDLDLFINRWGDQ